jgi:hypothetical protein
VEAGHVNIEEASIMQNHGSNESAAVEIAKGSTKSAKASHATFGFDMPNLSSSTCAQIMFQAASR